MSIYPVEKAQNDLQQLIDEATESHKPVTIIGKNNSVVILAEEDWLTIERILYSGKANSTQLLSRQK